MNKISKIITLIIIVQLIFVVYLGFRIVGKKKAVSVVRIKKDLVEVKGTRALKYFYDLRPNHVDETILNWLPDKAVNTINQDALNETRDYLVEKPPRTFRIMAIGDSFTYGVYVDTENNWTELLENELNSKLSCQNIDKIEVINLGVLGYDIEYATERYRQRGQKYEPDLIVWLLVDNTRILEKTTPIKKQCQEANPASEDDIPDYLCDRVAQKRVLAEMGRENMDTYIAESFDRLFDFYEKKALIVNLNSLHTDILKKSRNLKRLKILDIDLYDKEEYQLLDDHPNNQGHQYLSENIYSFIVEKGLLPCDKVTDH